MEASVPFQPTLARVLVLNASYEPLQIVSWERAVLLLFGEKVDVIELYSHVFIRSPSMQLQLPSVLKLKSYITPRRLKRLVRFSRQHVFLRDGYTCQYCLESFSEDELTLDHVVPVVRGGQKTWSNIVSSCAECNQKKGGRTPQEAGFHHFRMPKDPAPGFLPDTLYFRETMPESWRPYLDFSLGSGGHQRGGKIA